MSALGMDSPPPGAPDLIHLGTCGVQSDSPPAPAHSRAVHFTLPGSARCSLLACGSGGVCVFLFLGLPGAAFPDM
ncbi:unnamed protein product [Rangifer tarandus platyrhynchus]|uniref:Uncharacterized protein n=1 Tax=Rangifer tarandus platyrhynchus TaxID=3082113 RepID=A0ABN8YJB6_RANTA|nr:unnamed protein product [Rangifer tarandus platyrhynchus]